MQKKGLTRRDVLTKAVPAAAIAAATLDALAQQAPAPGQAVPPGQTLPPGMPVEPGRPVTPGPTAAAQPGQLMATMGQQMFSNGQYTLPPLPYSPDALEPNISAEIIQIHHDKHHQAYVNNLNKTHEKLDEAVRGGNLEQVPLDGLMRDLSYNAGGHVLHSLYWVNMAPPSGAENAPQGDLAEAINTRFGSFEQFKNLFTRTAVTVKSSGWALLVYSPISDRLHVLQVGAHDMRLVPGMLPVLTVDAWEHAYYLQYRNEREQYVNAWWNVVNWTAVNEIFTFFRKPNGAAENMQT